MGAGTCKTNHIVALMIGTFSVFFLLSALWTVAFSPSAYADSTEHANVVVVVRFSDDTVGDGATGYNAAYPYVINPAYTYWQQFKAGYENIHIPYFDNSQISLEKYMTTISNGAYDVKTYFPQDSTDGKTVAYITLPHAQSYYSNLGNDSELVSDTISRFNAAYPSPDASDWDKDSDGSIDNFTIIVQVSSAVDSNDTVLWPHRAQLEGNQAIDGKKVIDYNLIDSNSLTTSMDTAKHEYMHTVGLGDLYRVGDSSNADGPVSSWDCMGQADGQFPLAQSLIDVGFADDSYIKTISGAGDHTITLHEHFSTSDDGQAVKVASPYSPDEYFVFEYRSKSTDMAVDRRIPSSGLLVYRVNDSVPLDSFGHHTNKDNDPGYYQDYIYIFRPGETGIHDSEGDIKNAALNYSNEYAYGSTAHTTFGSSDYSKTIADDAIVDSSDRNTGMVVTVTGQTDDSITFTLSIPDYSKLDMWDEVGSSVTTEQSDENSVAVTSDGTLYQAYTSATGATTGTLCVRSWNGTKWTSLPNPASSNAAHPTLKVVGDELYCIYANYGSSHSVVCKKWNGTAWTQVGAISTGDAYSNSPASAVIDGTLYLLVDKSGASAQLYSLGSSGFATVGSTLTVGFIKSPSIAKVGGKLSIICGDIGSSWNATLGEQVYELYGSNWTRAYTEKANAANCTAAVTIGTGTNQKVIAFCAYDSTKSQATPQITSISASGDISTYQFDKAGNSIESASMFESGGKTYLSVVVASGQTASGKSTTWYCSDDDPSSWTQLGDTTYAKAYSVSSATDGTNALVGVTDSSYTSVAVVSHALAASPQAKKQYISIAGGSRYETMAGIVAKSSFTFGGSVIVASGANFPDALAASALAGALNAPIVLTTPDVLDSQTESALTSLAPKRVVIVGGGGAVSQSVADSISSLACKPTVNRIAGGSRYETAIKIRELGETDLGAVFSTDTCIIATGSNRGQGADALAISPYAYATKSPVFLASDDATLSPDTVAAICSGGYSHIVICGGTGAVSDSIKQQLAAGGLTAEYTRLGGGSRFETSLRICQWESGNAVSGATAESVPFSASDTGVNSGKVLSFNVVGVATGNNFPDALASSPLIGSKNGVLLLENQYDSTGGVCITQTLGSFGSSVQTCYFIGGTSALPDSVKATCRTLIGE